MTAFRKNANCPSSENLLAYQKGETPARSRDKIKVHLRFCDFCTAEVDLYSHYPQSRDRVDGPDIPAPLRELAEALLGSRRRDVLERLFTEERV